ncbi:MAG TPA: hypothetical protein VFC19_48775 [Candidatus Limnocylindrales bacterium]|nr:hypothetical protein [Candidatus Limnocylindrales bacterium]
MAGSPVLAAPMGLWCGAASRLRRPRSRRRSTALAAPQRSLWLAGLLAFTGIPGHLIAVPAQRAHHATRFGAGVWQALRDHRFWLLAVAFVAQGAAVSAVGVLLVSFLRHAGLSATIAAVVCGLLGVLSVTGCSYPPACHATTACPW